MQSDLEPEDLYVPEYFGVSGYSEMPEFFLAPEDFGLPEDVPDLDIPEDPGVPECELPQDLFGEFYLMLELEHTLPEATV